MRTYLPALPMWSWQVVVTTPTPQARAFSIAMPIASEATTMPRPPSPERAAVAGPSRNTSISGTGLMVRF